MSTFRSRDVARSLARKLNDRTAAQAEIAREIKAIYRDALKIGWSKEDIQILAARLRRDAEKAKSRATWKRIDRWLAERDAPQAEARPS